jgi:hypothetical protein
MATNKVSFYYRKDLNVTKHGEYKAAVAMPFGTAVKRNDVTLEAEVAANSAEFEGVVDKVIFNVQGADDLNIAAKERCRVGVGKDYEIVLMKDKLGSTVVVGDKIEVKDGKFQKVTTDTAVGKVVAIFPNGETVLRIN